MPADSVGATTRVAPTAKIFFLKAIVSANRIVPSALHLWWLNSYPESFEGGDVQQTKTVKDFTPAF